MNSRFRSAAVPGFALLSVLGFAPFLPAQNAPPPPKTPLKTTKTSKSAAKSPNVKPGELVALDTSNGTIKIKDRAGKEESYDLTDKTRYLKSKREAEATAFKPGDAVVVHIRKARDGGDPQATEVADRDSWAWIDNLKHNMTEAVITSLDDDGLTVAVGADKIPLTYTVSDKTMWSKGGKEVTASDYKAGDKVYVLPRALPSGAIMARAVTDTPAAGAQMKERQATSVHGVVKSVDAAAFTFTVETAAKDTRTLQGNAETEVVQKSKTLGWNSLRAGQNVGARLRRNFAGEPVCWRVTIESKTVKKTKPAAIKTAVKPTAK